MSGQMHVKAREGRTGFDALADAAMTPDARSRATSPFRVGQGFSGGVMKQFHDTTEAKAMKLMKTLTACALAAATFAATPAMSLEPLAQDKYINDRLIAARIADRIRRECPSYSARMVYAYNQARALKKYARDKGYSEAQIDTFLDSKEDKRRIYGVAEEYLTRKGAVKGNADSFCTVGAQEFANNSYVATFLVKR